MKILKPVIASLLILSFGACAEIPLDRNVVSVSAPKPPDWVLHPVQATLDEVKAGKSLAIGSAKGPTLAEAESKACGRAVRKALLMPAGNSNPVTTQFYYEKTDGMLGVQYHYYCSVEK